MDPLIKSQLTFDYFKKIKIEKFFIMQVNGYGIGNFINCTPAIRLLSEHYGRPIPVFFESEIIKKMFEHCDFIETLTSMPHHIPCLFNSSLVSASIEDWLYIQKRVRYKLSIKRDMIYNTYVDTQGRPIILKGKKYVVIVRGMVENSDYWINIKDPGDAIYKHIIDNISEEYSVVFIGAAKDYDYCIKRMTGWVDHCIPIIDDIKASIGAINEADFVVSNDTGMYHAAGALDKKSFVLWKKTRFKKNRAPSQAITYSFQKNWEKDFHAFLKGR